MAAKKRPSEVSPTPAEKRMDAELTKDYNRWAKAHTPKAGAESQRKDANR